MHPIPAIYFDGHSARPQPVTIRLHDGRLIVDGDSVTRDAPIAGLEISEPLGAAPRVVRFADGASCEVREHAAFEDLLRAAGIEDGFAVRLQARWHWALAAVVLTVATALAGYHWGLPAAADWIAGRLPERLLDGMAESTLSILDAHVFETSTLEETRRARLVADFERLNPPDGTTPAHRILFRDGGPIGANAFALPDGTLVVTDQLVTVAGNDAEILGVLAHELGHLEGRHSLRMLIQGSIVGILVGWYLGDVSSVAAGLPSALLQARYSRDFEREADGFALRMLEANGLPPTALADILARMQAEAACAHGAGTDPLRGYLSSHPATSERIIGLGGTPQAVDCPPVTRRTGPGCSGGENEYLATFLDVHGWHCEQDYADRAALARALAQDARLRASTAYDGVFETDRHGVSYAVIPEDAGCTTDVLLQPADRETALFSLNEINAGLLECGYRDTGRETESTAEGLDGTTVPVTDIEYLSPAGERVVLTYPLEHPASFYLTLTVEKF
jgi:Zn-dependent protease with chaperone function